MVKKQNGPKFDKMDLGIKFKGETFHYSWFRVDLEKAKL